MRTRHWVRFARALGCPVFERMLYLVLGIDEQEAYLLPLQTSDMPYPVMKIRERTFETRSLMLMRKVLSGLTSLTDIR